jgi:hypothetical protein
VTAVVHGEVRARVCNACIGRAVIGVVACTVFVATPGNVAVDAQVRVLVAVIGRTNVAVRARRVQRATVGHVRVPACVRDRIADVGGAWIAVVARRVDVTTSAYRSAHARMPHASVRGAVIGVGAVAILVATSRNGVVCARVVGQLAIIGRAHVAVCARRILCAAGRYWGVHACVAFVFVRQMLGYAKTNCWHVSVVHGLASLQSATL